MSDERKLVIAVTLIGIVACIVLVYLSCGKTPHKTVRQQPANPTTTPQALETKTPPPGSQATKAIPAVPSKKPKQVPRTTQAAQVIATPEPTPCGADRIANGTMALFPGCELEGYTPPPEYFAFVGEKGHWDKPEGQAQEFACDILPNAPFCLVELPIASLLRCQCLQEIAQPPDHLGITYRFEPDPSCAWERARYIVNVIN